MTHQSIPSHFSCIMGTLDLHHDKRGSDGQGWGTVSTMTFASSPSLGEQSKEGHWELVSEIPWKMFIAFVWESMVTPCLFANSSTSLWTVTSSRSLCVMVDGWKTVSSSDQKQLKNSNPQRSGNTSVSDKEKHFQRANHLIYDLTDPLHMPALLLTSKGTENLSWTLHLNNYYSMTLIRTLTIFHWWNWIGFTWF